VLLSLQTSNFPGKILTASILSCHLVVLADLSFCTFRRSKQPNRAWRILTKAALVALLLLHLALTNAIQIHKRMLSAINHSRLILGGTRPHVLLEFLRLRVTLTVLIIILASCTCGRFLEVVLAFVRRTSSSSIQLFFRCTTTFCHFCVPFFHFNVTFFHFCIPDAKPAVCVSLFLPHNNLRSVCNSQSMRRLSVACLAPVLR
jgi:hypothetical protein